MLLLAKQEVDAPAAADVRPRSAEMAQEIRISTPRVFKGVCQDRQPGQVEVPLGQGPTLVNLLRKSPDHGVVPRQPGGVDADGAEGQRAEEVADQAALLVKLSPPPRLIDRIVIDLWLVIAAEHAAALAAVDATERSGGNVPP